MGRDKKHIQVVKKNFSDSVKKNEYQKNAIVQLNITNRIAQEVFFNIPTSKKIKILEIGSGSGFLTKKLVKLFKDIEIIHTLDIIKNNNLNSKFKKLNHKHFNSLDEISLKYDLIISSSSIHWIMPSDNFIKWSKQKLEKNGKLIFSNFILGNYQELSTSLDITKLYYEKPSLIEKNIIQNGFVIKNKTLFEDVLLFEKQIDVFKHFKKIGVNFINSKNKKSIFYYKKKLENNFLSKQSLTHKSIFIICTL